ARPPETLHPETLIWRVRRGLQLDTISGTQIAFCGIARPGNFFAQLRQVGVKLAAEISFSDHYRYTPGDIQQLCELQRRHDPIGFVTKEKDAVNLGSLAAELEPLSIARVTMELDPADAIDTMLRIITGRKHGA